MTHFGEHLTYDGHNGDYTARGFISADVYTCKNGLDVDTIKQFFRARFKISDEEVHFIKRGTRYPLHNICHANNA